jgi:branched-chain amino acid transport system ATP-binding protein
MSEPLLRLRGVTKTFGGITALRDVSLTVTRGDIGGLIGPNGAGKTTVFNVITGACGVNLGEVLLGQRPIHRLKSYRIARLGVARTFQNIRLFASMTIWEHLLVAQRGTMLRRALPASLADVGARRRAEQVLAFLGLDAYRDRLAASLSYGLQRKVEIARALTSAPKLLLLDEPVAGMNEEESEDLRGLILKLKEMGLTIFVIEHDMPFVMRLCDYLYVLDFGAVIASGDPESVRRNPVVIDAYMGQPIDALG